MLDCQFAYLGPKFLEYVKKETNILNFSDIGGGQRF